MDRSQRIDHTGSIGVIMHGLNYRGLLDKIGVRPEVYKSGRFKDMLSSTKTEDEITPESARWSRTSLTNVPEIQRCGCRWPPRSLREQQSKGTKTQRDWEDYADGRILSARRHSTSDSWMNLVILTRPSSGLKSWPGSRRACQFGRISAGVRHLELPSFVRQSDAKAVKWIWGDFPRLKAGYLYFLHPLICTDRAPGHRHRPPARSA